MPPFAYFYIKIRLGLKGSIQHIPWLGQLLVLLGIYLIGEYIFILTAIGIIDLIFPGIDFIHFITDLSKIKSADQINLQQEQALKIYQFTTSFGRFILVSIFFIYLKGERFVESVSLNKSMKITSYLVVLATVVASGAIISVVHNWNQMVHLPASLSNIEADMRFMESQAELQTEVFLRTTDVGGFILNIIIIGLLAAVGEEIFFRGLVQNIFFKATKNPHAAIWIAAFLFSFIHFQFFGFFPRLLMGALLGYLYYYSGSLWSAILAHFFNNVVTVIAYYLMNTGVIEKNIAETANIWAALASVPIVLLLLRYFKQHETALSLSDGKRLDDDLLDNGQDESNFHKRDVE
jgi:uncharacterized protein